MRIIPDILTQHAEEALTHKEPGKVFASNDEERIAWQQERHE